MEDIIVKTTLEVKITQEDIDDIMCAALEGGINYWCCRAEVIGEYLGEWAHEQISRGGKLRLYDSETDDKWILTRNKFVKGFRKWFATKRGREVIYDGGIDCCLIDADDADSIIQYALFGEIVFG